MHALHAKSRHRAQADWHAAIDPLIVTRELNSLPFSISFSFH